MNKHHSETTDTKAQSPRGDRRREGPGSRPDSDSHGPPDGRRPTHAGRAPRGRNRATREADLPPTEDATDWFAGRLPTDWYAESPTITIDRDEILVHGELLPIENEDSAHSSAAAQGRISRWRRDTRTERMAIAEEAQARYHRTVSWGASLAGESVLFTHLAVPTMTRLRQPERQVLDTLVDAGVARSRSDAVAWAVTLVGQHSQEWLAELREAMSNVEQVRDSGPQA